MKKFGALRIILLLLLFSFITVNAAVWYVHPDSTLNAIQAGIDSSSSSDTVLVAKGTYVENINFKGKAITVMSEFGRDSTIIDGGSPLNLDSASVVAFVGGEDTNSVLDGFTLTNGKGIFLPFYEFCGGGIFILNSKPRIKNVTISGNFSTTYGGGIYCVSNSNPSLTNVIISENAAEFGGGICCDFSSNPSLTNVIISGDSSATYGGGISCGNSSSPSLTNVIISGNTSGVHGGGIGLDGTSNPSLTNVIISENSADWYGGGVIVEGGSSPSLTNVTISGNTAGVNGGGILCNFNGNPILVNCILWNDTPNEVDILTGSVTATYSDIQGGWSGTGNIDVDPVFVSGPLSEYHLCPSTPSPCIDAGNPDAQYNDLEDPFNPGYAKLPALGTIRNDMGVYGGPGTEIWAGVEEGGPDVGFLYISRCYPNPFIERIRIEYNLPIVSDVSISVYNVFGAKVRSLLSKRQNAGRYTITWGGRGERGSKLPGGMYFLRLEAGMGNETRKLLLVK